MTPDVWHDILIRLRNLRGDIIVQWQGDIDNANVENAVSMLGSVIRLWEGARPPREPAQTQATAE